MALTAIAFWVIYISGVLASTALPLAGVLLYILVYHLNPDDQWWGQSIREWGLRTSLIVVVSTTIGIAVRLPRFKDGERQFPLPLLAMLVLVVLSWASFTWGYGPSERSYVQAEKLTKVFVFLLILIRCVRTPAHYQAVVITWILGVAYIGYQAWGGVGIHISGRLAYGVGGPDFAESSDLAVHLVATLPLIGAMFFMSRTAWMRGLMLLVGALAVNTIVLTRTRNAMVGLSFMGLTAALSLPRGQRLRGVLAICLGGVLAVQLADPGFWTRMQSVMEYRHDDSALSRLTYWSAAAQMAADYPLGIGIGNFHTAVLDYVHGLNVVRSAHSTYMECYAELGSPGLALLVFLLWVTMRRTSDALKFANRQREIATSPLPSDTALFHLGWHAMALRAGLAGYLASAAFTTRIWAEDFWILIGLAACLDNVRRKLAGVSRRELATIGIAEPADGSVPQPAFRGGPTSSSLGTAR